MNTIFSSYDIRGRADESLTVEQAWTVGKAVAEWLPEQGVAVVGKSANANEAIANAVIEGLLLQGRNVVQSGDDQQAVVEAIGTIQAAGGVLVSHDEVQGLEIITLFDTNGVTVTAEKGLMEIAELIEAGNFVPAANKGELTTAS